jgi:hypothetical protein
MECITLTCWFQPTNGVLEIIRKATTGVRQKAYRHLLLVAVQLCFLFGLWLQSARPPLAFACFDEIAGLDDMSGFGG